MDPTKTPKIFYGPPGITPNEPSEPIGGPHATPTSQRRGADGSGRPAILPWLLIVLGAGLVGGAFVGFRLLGRVASTPPPDDNVPGMG